MALRLLSKRRASAGTSRARQQRVVQNVPTRTLGQIKAQHSMLRGMLDRCEALADELDAGRCGPLQLTREVTRLRLAFDAHNKFEEELLRPLLLAGVPAAVLERSVEEHVASHRAMRAGLASDETSVLRDVIDSMRAHLDAEEAYLRTLASVRVPANAG